MKGNVRSFLVVNEKRKEMMKFDLLKCLVNAYCRILIIKVKKLLILKMGLTRSHRKIPF